MNQNTPFPDKCDNSYYSHFVLRTFLQLWR